MRFQGFTTPWTEIEIGKAFQVTRGYVLPTTVVRQDASEEYIYPVYSSQTKDNGLMGYYNDYLYENAITWTTDGANAGTVHYRPGKFYCTNVCGVLLSDEGNANRCVAEILGSVSKKYVSYVGNPKLMNNVMSEIKIYVPTIDEQKKIDDFISVIDHRIEKQLELIEHLKKYKRGLHDRIFSHLSDSKCEKADLRSIATFCGGGTPSKVVPSYWNGNIGWISSSDVHEEWVDTISVTRRINDIAISNSATKLCPSGTIAIVSRVGVGKVALMSEDLCTSQDFTNITSIKGNTLFMTYQIAYKMKIEAAKTQGTSIKGITAEEIKSLKIDIPADEEQRYIATLLSSLDIRLRQEIRKADCLHTLKNALLQQLFI